MGLGGGGTLANGTLLREGLKIIVGKLKNELEAVVLNDFKLNVFYVQNHNKCCKCRLACQLIDNSTYID